jgi:small-conductance mechanosensitive channel
MTIPLSRTTRNRVFAVASKLALAVLVIVHLALASRAHAQTAPQHLDSPRRTLETFFAGASAQDWPRAAEALDLRQQRKDRGPELARQLYVVLDRAVWIDRDSVPDDTTLKAGEKTYRLALVPLAGHDVPITLSVDREGRWLFSSSTVAQVPPLYEKYGPGVIESNLPPSLARLQLGHLALWQWLGILLALPLAYVLGRLVAFLVGIVAARITKQTPAKWDDQLVERLRGPSRIFCALVAFNALLEPLTLPAAAVGTLGNILKIGFLAVLGFAVIRTVSVVASTIEERATEAVVDRETMTGVLHARGVTTQVRVLRRVINIAVGVLVIALMLTQFEIVRSVGVSLLASAGLAGVVLGLAAQRTIGSLIAGIQLSVTQPIRIGDEVVIEKEFGVIEEITLTYVLVRVWDERRLIVPMTRFLEQPFENWTKVSAHLTGAVILHADATLPVAALRAELDRLIVEEPLWDGRTKAVHVTETSDRSITVRVLVTARSASALFDLRARIREKLLVWLSSYEGGRYLPLTRAFAVTAAMEDTTPIR